MARAYKLKKRWYIDWRDVDGKRVRQSTTAETKAEAMRMASELEHEARKRAIGLTAAPTGLDRTFGDIVQWWLPTCASKAASCATDVSRVRTHLETWAGYNRRMRSLRPADFHALIEGKKAVRSPQTVKHIRALVRRIFKAAHRHGIYTGPDLSADLPVIKLRRRVHTTLTTAEARMVVDNLSDEWQPLFATALYTGMRKGELFGLQKADVDMERAQIRVRRSHDRDQTKTGNERLVPISDELKPWLRLALQRSPSALVFPKADGKRRRPDTKLVRVLKGAMARAGLADSYNHICRRKGCGHAENAADDALRLCPACDMKLWPKAIVRSIRFHDLRHTCATLLMEAGVPLPVVSEILGHTDTAITWKLYAHARPDWVRAETEKFHLLDAPKLGDEQPELDVEPMRLAAVAGTIVAQAALDTPTSDDGVSANVLQMNGNCGRATQDSNLRPLASEAQQGQLSHRSTSSQPAANTTLSRRRRGTQKQIAARRDSSGGTNLAHAGTPPRPRLTAIVGGASRYLSVRQAASQLSVSTAIVYRLIDRGDLAHVRVSNAIRIPLSALREYLGRSNP